MSKVKNELRIAGVYKITNLINNKVYIGESLNIEERWIEHKLALEEGTHHSYKLQADYNTYGIDKFEFEIIEEVDKELNNSVQELICLVYEDKYIKRYNSIEKGYNIEYTLTKMINMEKEIFHGSGINERYVYLLKNIITNINKNGKYIQPDTVREQKQREIDNRLKKEIVVKEEFILKNIDMSLPISFKNCTDYYKSINYKFNCSYNDIYKILRELNIFYYDENKLNVSSAEFLNKYFIIEFFTSEHGKICNKIYVTIDGIEFLKNILLDNKIINL